MLEQNPTIITRNNTQLMNLLRERRRNGVPYRKIAHEFTLMGVVTEYNRPVNESHLCKLITQGPDGKALSGGREAKQIENELSPRTTDKVLSTRNKEAVKYIIELRAQGMEYKDIEAKMNQEGWTKPNGRPTCRASISQVACAVGYRSKKKAVRKGKHGNKHARSVKVPQNFTPPVEKPKLLVNTEYVHTPKKDWVLWTLLATQAILVASLLVATVAQ